MRTKLRKLAGQQDGAGSGDKSVETTGEDAGSPDTTADHVSARAGESATEISGQ